MIQKLYITSGLEIFYRVDHEKGFEVDIILNFLASQRIYIVLWIFNVDALVTIRTTIHILPVKTLHNNTEMLIKDPQIDIVS